MSIKGDLVMVGIVGAVAAAGIWYVNRKLSSAASAVGGAISGTAQTAWDTMQTPVSTLGAANGIATSIVDAPSNALDALSLGLISGQGGTTGNGGIGAYLWNIVSGEAFAPSGAKEPDLGPIDYGKGGW
jgi:hypothetical protein